MNLELKFPNNFFWGAATASHQVEGGNVNQWSEWEKKNADRLAEGTMFKPENYISGRATDHYNKFEEDFDLAKGLHHNAHRFSIEWSRVEPEEGKFNQKEIEHYKKVVEALKERDIEPFVSLYHWTMPLWLAEKGGWLNKNAPEYFESFASKMAQNLPQVKFWLTINEPIIYASNGYLRACWPPQKRSFIKFLRAVNNLIRAHRLVYYSLHTRLTGCQVGPVKNNVYFEGNILAYFADLFWNHYFLKKVKDKMDLIGLNYYFHNHISGFGFNQNKNKETTDMGWEIYPEGMTTLNGTRAFGLDLA